MKTKAERELESPDWWSREVPYIDWDKEDGDVGHTFEELFRTDDAYEWHDIHTIYINSSMNEKRVINRVFIHLCGYSFVTIIKKVGSEMQEEMRKAREIREAKR